MRIYCNGCGYLEVNKKNLIAPWCKKYKNVLIILNFKTLLYKPRTECPNYRNYKLYRKLKKL